MTSDVHTGAKGGNRKGRRNTYLRTAAQMVFSSYPLSTPSFKGRENHLRIFAQQVHTVMTISDWENQFLFSNFLEEAFSEIS